MNLSLNPWQVSVNARQFYFSSPVHAVRAYVPAPASSSPSASLAFVSPGRPGFLEDKTYISFLADFQHMAWNLAHNWCSGNVSQGNRWIIIFGPAAKLTDHNCGAIILSWATPKVVCSVIHGKQTMRSRDLASLPVPHTWIQMHIHMGHMHD